MFGINGGEALVLLLVAVIVVGPERLPRYAQQLGIWVRHARSFVQDAKAKVDDELGAESTGVDWQALDPRRYDPRRIVREALLEDIMPSTTQRSAAPPGTTAGTVPSTSGPTSSASGTTLPPTSNGRAA